jgi:hypothetical protein
MVVIMLKRFKELILFAQFLKMQALVKAIYFVLLQSSHPFFSTYKIVL